MGHKVREEGRKEKYTKVLDSHNNNAGLHPSRRCPGRGLRLLGEGERWEAANQLLLTFSSQAVEGKNRTDTMAAAAACRDARTRVAVQRRRLTEPKDKTGLESNRAAR